MIKVNKFFFPYIILLIFLGFKGQFILAFLIVFFHEAIHYLTAVFFGFSGFDMEILPIGARLSLNELEDASLKQDIIISLSAPIFNVAVAVIFYYINKSCPNEVLYLLYKGNITVGLFNLIPAFPLDGGRVLRCFMCYRTIYKKANELTIKFSIVIGAGLIFIYFLLLFFKINNINIAVIAVLIIYSSYKEKERIVYIIMGDIVKKRYKFLKNRYMENKNLSIHYKCDLITALSIIDKNKFNIFTVLDDEMKFMDIIYEDEVIEGLKVFGNLTIEEFINNRE